jgi:hypothetical protein
MGEQIGKPIVEPGVVAEQTLGEILQVDLQPSVTARLERDIQDITDAVVYEDLANQRTPAQLEKQYADELRWLGGPTVKASSETE